MLVPALIPDPWQLRHFPQSKAALSEDLFRPDVAKLPRRKKTHTVDGRQMKWKPWEYIVYWYLRGTSVFFFPVRNGIRPSTATGSLLYCGHFAGSLENWLAVGKPDEEGCEDVTLNPKTPWHLGTSANWAPRRRKSDFRNEQRTPKNEESDDFEPYHTQSQLFVRGMIGLDVNP